MSDGRDDADDAGRDVNAAFSEEDYLPDGVGDEPGDGGRPPTARQTRSADEFNKRIELTAWMLDRRMQKWEVKARLKKDYDCSARTCETYLSRARKLILERSQKPRQEHFNEAAGFYLSIMQDPRTSTAEKLRAQEDLVALYGLEPPKELRMSGGSGPPLRVVRAEDMTDDELAATAAGAAPAVAELHADSTSDPAADDAG